MLSERSFLFVYKNSFYISSLTHQYLSKKILSTSEQRISNIRIKKHKTRKQSKKLTEIASTYRPIPETLQSLWLSSNFECQSSKKKIKQLIASAHKTLEFSQKKWIKYKWTKKKRTQEFHQFFKMFHFLYLFEISYCLNWKCKQFVFAITI